MRTRLVGTVMLLSLGIALRAWAGAQGKGQCQFPGDGVDGPALRYRTQSNGTVTDLNTGLMWEMKDRENGIHSVNRTFTWSALLSTGVCSETAPNGTVFTVFLDTLNHTCAGDETTACTKNADCQHIGNGQCGYAGHRDWRIPNFKELQSIVDYGIIQTSQTFQPAIDPTFGPTRAPEEDRYWTFTTDALHPTTALFVNFDNGFVSTPDCKSFALLVRAVRDRQCQ